MKTFAATCFVFAVTAGWFGSAFAEVVGGQEKARDRQSSQQAKISDEELKAFAKTYVEFQKIRLAYDNSLDQVRDRQEQSKAQHEALIKIEKAFQRQGLEQDTFARIFEIVKADDALWAKTMKLIEQERRAAG
jgi:hypothetical protein